MTNFSTNQVLQFYVADTTLDVVKSADGNIVYLEANDKSFRTDNLTNVMSITTVSKAFIKAGKVVILKAKEAIKGQDYVVRVSYPEVGGLGVEGWTTKTVVAHATSTAVSDLYSELGKALKKALEVDGVLKCNYSESGVDIFSVFDSKMYKRGVRPVCVADFKVSTNLIEDEDTGVELDWGVQTITNGIVEIPNGYKYADMEYFAMGERGDQYRMMGYPDVIDTEYKINPIYNYGAMIVHYAYEGANDTSYKSEKDLVIVYNDNKFDPSIALSTATGVPVVSIMESLDILTD